MQLVALKDSPEAMEVQADELLAATEAIFQESQSWFITHGMRHDRKGQLTEFHGTDQEKQAAEEFVKRHMQLEAKVRRLVERYNELAKQRG